jgi:Fe-S cluster biogenesis protein NfuA
MNIPFNDDELFEAITNILNDKIATYIKNDGGDIELIKVQDAIVYVKLKGACVGCAGSTSTIKNVVEKELCRLIHPNLKVEQVK